MNHKILLAISALGVLFVWAAAGGADPITIDWCTVDQGGAMTLSAGSLTLSTTHAQPDAGRMSGGSFTLTGGYWFELSLHDCDYDGDVDLDDYSDCSDCLHGPMGELDESCDCFDLNDDGGVDLVDFAEFQKRFCG